MIGHALAGLLTGLALIVAIGAQNAFVLRQGLARDHIGVVVAICALSDLVLIVAGTAGMGAVVASHPTALRVLRWVGAAYLAWYGIGSLRRSRHAEGLQAKALSRGSVVATTLALTWLNPHVYLDTVLMLGNIANQHGRTGRWWFAGGAATASLLWFSGLGLGARALAGRLASPRTWQVLDVVIGVVMLALAAMLALG